MKIVKQFILHLRNAKYCSFGKKAIISRKTLFEGKNYIGSKTSFKNSNMGFQSYIGDNSELDNTIVGRYSCISHHVIVVQGQHPTKDFVSIHPAFFKKDYQHTYVSNDCFASYKYIDIDNKVSCIIGNDVWVGYGAMIMAGVTIGDGAIVAAGAIVIRDVEPYSIVAGSPAKEIKKRFSEEDIMFLKEIKWWEKDEKWISSHSQAFDDIHKLKTIINN